MRNGRQYNPSSGSGAGGSCGRLRRRQWRLWRRHPLRRTDGAAGVPVGSGMITVTEPIIWGDEHVPVNTGLLETVVRAFPHERVRFHAESSHIALVRALIDRDDGARVEFRETKLPPRGADFRTRFRHDLGLVGRLMDEAAGSHLIMASSCPSLIAALKLRGLRTAVR